MGWDRGLGLSWWMKSRKGTMAPSSVERKLPHRRTNQLRAAESRSVDRLWAWLTCSVGKGCRLALIRRGGFEGGRNGSCREKSRWLRGRRPRGDGARRIRVALTTGDSVGGLEAIRTRRMNRDWDARKTRGSKRTDSRRVLMPPRLPRLNRRTGCRCGSVAPPCRPSRSRDRLLRPARHRR
jgi:hypothetical protein